jgi:hypothetical protein
LRCCFVFHESSGDIGIGILECLEAPPHVEFNDPRNFIPMTRVLERLTGRCDPVDGIVLYEEVVR